MKLKATGLMLAVAVLLGMIVVPAAADVSAGPHVGVFVGEAKVGKNGTCNNDGTGTVSGGGIGLLPEIGQEGKNAWFTIEAGTVVDGGSLFGTANLCGRLAPPLYPEVDLKAEGVGATCLATKGWGGHGLADFAPAGASPNDIWITNLGWKATVGGTFVVFGDVSGAKPKKEDLLVAQVQALSEGAVAGCLEKTAGDKSTVQPFTVVATYEIIPGASDAYREVQPKKDPKKKP